MKKLSMLIPPPFAIFIPQKPLEGEVSYFGTVITLTVLFMLIAIPAAYRIFVKKEIRK